MKTTLAVRGMTCGACSSSITTQLEALPGVSHAMVSLITEEAEVIHNNTVTTADELQESIEDCGFDAQVLRSEEDGVPEPVADHRHGHGGKEGNTTNIIIYKTRIKVGGMTCSNCTNSVRQAVETAEGVLKFDISLITEEAAIEHDISVISADDLKEMVEDVGFDAQVLDSVKLSNEIVETVISVKGMTCGACTSSVTNVLNDFREVIDASVSLITEQANVKHYDSLDPNALKNAIEDCGFDAEIVETLREKQSPLLENTKFDVDSVIGIDSLMRIDGVISTSLINDSVVSIQYDSTKTGVRDLIKAMDHLQIKATPQNILDFTSQLETLNKSNEIKFWKWNFIKTSFVGAPMFINHHVLHMFGINFSWNLGHGVYLESLIEMAFATYIQFTVGLFFWKNAKNALKHGSGTMDSLVCISTNISYYFSILAILITIIRNNNMMPPHTLFETAVLLMNFVSLGKWMESRAKSETSSSLSKLISLTSSECTIFEDGESFDPETGTGGITINIPISYLQVHDVVEIKPGEKIPADGIILYGESEVDESLLTGESIPLVKTVNDKVLGGSINGIGHIFIKVTTTSENSQLSKIIKLVKSAQMNRAPIQSYADFVASIFVPVILCLALITFICWLILCNVLSKPPAVFQNSNGKFYICLQIAISVIVVACPCALGLAAPTAIMVGTGVSASHGILIKGGDALEHANDIDVLLFDKTGTLTVGEMIVKEVHLVGDLPKEDVLTLVGSLESQSEHPIGVAINKFVIEKTSLENFNTTIQNFKVEIGKGLTANILQNDVNYKVSVGNLRLFSDDLLANDENFQALKIDSDNTLAHIVIDDKYQGYMELQDVVKNDSALVISFLKSQGFEIAMVTGDSQKVANRIALQVGIPLRNVFAEISPYGKEQLVCDFQNRGLKVAFVGDGINDSPALASADLGIAIASGTDIALEAADIVLLNNEVKLNGVSSAISVSQCTLRRIKWNFFWSSVYNFTMVPIAMGILIPWGITLSPLVAGGAMAFSSVSVVLSSLWLKRWSPPDLTGFDNFVNDDDEENFNIDLENGSVNHKRRVGRWKLNKSIKEMLKWKKQKRSDDVELQTGLLGDD